MKIHLRESEPNDFPFLREMLYEAVFWRANPNKPSFEEGLSYPDVKKALAGLGERDGDAAVVATIDSVSVGAAWYRFWTDSNPIRGYVDKEIPVLAIAVHRDYRHRGIGKKMIDWLIEHASKQNIQRIGLCVSKDNYALNLYKQQGFHTYEDIGDSLIMVRSLID